MLSASPNRRPASRAAEDRHILVVDDEADVRQMLQEYLMLQGFAVSTADSAPSARRVLGARAVDMLVLDLRMPGEDGLGLARELRGRGIAIIILTACSGVVDRVVGLELGADDYVTKPFDPPELLARIRSVLRRVKPATPPGPVRDRRRVRFGLHLLDLDARRLFAFDGSEVPVTAMELDLLEAFSSNPNRVLSRDRLLELAHRGGGDPFDRSIDTRVARLRQKLEPCPGKPQAIRTVRGTGYMFVPATAPRETESRAEALSISSARCGGRPRR